MKRLLHFENCRFALLVSIVGIMMTKEEKTILSVPDEFLNTVDKLLYNEMFKGTLCDFLDNNTIEINNGEKLFSLKRTF